MKPIDIPVSQLKTGDVFLQHTKFVWYKPLTWFSALIRKFTKSRWNHTSECLIINWEAYMIESLASGITLRTRKDWVDEPYERDMMWQRYNKPFYTNEKDYIIHCLMELDKKYDWMGIVKMTIYLFFGRWNQGETTSESQWRCSEYTAYNKWLEWRPRYMPRDFANNEDFTILWV